MSLAKHVGVSMSIQCSFWTVLVPASFELSMPLEDGSGEVVSVAVKASWIAMAMSTSLRSVTAQGFKIVECGLRAIRFQPE